MHLRRPKIAEVWSIPLGGSDAFALSREHVLFRGGYGHRDLYELYRLSAGEPVLNARIQLQDRNQGNLAARFAVGRGPTMHLICGDSYFRVEVGALVDELKLSAKS